MLCTLARPTSGTARVSGFDVAAARDDVRRHIGLVFQDQTLDGYLTAEQNLRLHAELYGIDPGVIPERMRQMLEMVDLWDRRDRAGHDLLRRHATAPGDRPRPHALAARAVPRRADHRPRPPDPQLDLALHPRPAGDRGHDDLHDHALHGRGGVLRPHRDHGPRGDRRAGHARGAQGERRGRPRGAGHRRRRGRPGRAARPLRHRGDGGRGRGDVPRRRRRGVRPAAVRRARRRRSRRSPCRGRRWTTSSCATRARRSGTPRPDRRAISAARRCACCRGPADERRCERRRRPGARAVLAVGGPGGADRLATRPDPLHHRPHARSRRC